MDAGLSHDTIGAMLALFVAVPLLAAGLLVIFRKVFWLQTVVLFTVLGASLAGAIVLIAELAGGEVIAHGVGDFAFGVAIPFAADMFTALMLTTTAILALLSAWFAAASGYLREPFFAPMVLVLMTGVYGALLTADAFNFFVFIEVMLLPSYGLYATTIHRRGGDLMLGGMRLYIAANLLASTTLLAGVGLVYATAGTVNLGQLAGAASEDPMVAIAMSIVLLAMLTKAAVVPVHSWLARTYSYTSPAMTALISGLHTKVAVYAIYRFYAVVFDGDTRFLWVLVTLFTATMLIGVLGAVGEKTTRSILVFHMISQLGYILMGVALFTELGLTAGIFYLVHHMLVKASLFLSTGAVEVKYGTGELDKVTDIARREPLIAVSFFAAALSLAGIPPFSGFVAKFSLMLGTFEAGRYIALAVMVIVSLITLLSMLKIWNGMFWGDPKTPAPDPAAGQDPDGEGATLGGGVALVTRTEETRTEEATSTVPRRRISLWLAAPAAILALLTLAIGLGGEVLLGWAETAAHGLMDTTGYVEAVSNS